MTINNEFMIMTIAHIMHNVLGARLCELTQKKLRRHQKDAMKIDNDEKFYYYTYGLRICTKLANYMDNINMMQLVGCENREDHFDDASEQAEQSEGADFSEIPHDFLLYWGDAQCTPVSLDYNGIEINNLIPEKLMHVYSRDTKSDKHVRYKKAYLKLNDQGYKKIKKQEKFTNVDAKIKNKYVLAPICQLVADTMQEQGCAQTLCRFLFREHDRIVLRLYKNRFIIYDFGLQVKPVKSFKLAVDGANLEIEFNNGFKFVLHLKPNSTQIKQSLALKFRTDFKSLQDIYVIASGSAN